MPLVIDPSGREIRALQKAAQWDRKRVLELGCGDGRLTLRLAALGPTYIEALDTDAVRVRAARRNCPARLSKRIAYHVGYAERLKYPKELFDIAIFSWSL